MPKPFRPPHNDPVRTPLAAISKAMKQGQHSACLPKLVALRQANPKDPRIAWALGSCNAALGRHAEAIEAFEIATKLDDQSPDLRLALAYAYQRGGQYEQALVALEQALFRRPGDFTARRMQASVLMDLARWDKAANVVERLLEDPKSARVPASERAILTITAARLAPRHRDPKLAIAELEAMASNPSANKPNLTTCHWHLGRLYEAEADFDKAFAHYTASNESNLLPWNPDEHAARIDRVIECWKDGDIPRAPRDGSSLIFILGMMRSGTSLTEQMLAQLDAITPGGEMNAVSRQVTAVDPVPIGHLRPLPITKAKYTQPIIDRMATEAWKYYDAISRVGFVTDKQPYNYLYVPLLTRLFPGCTIVHCTRDPQDTCLSNFFQSFSRPHPQTQTLERLGRYYRDYQRCMAAFAEMPGVSMIEMPYEQLVTEPRERLTPVLDRIGLAWDDAILRFHESDRTVSTSSRDQVRKPLYKSSVKKHDRYAAHLAPLREALGLDA